MIPYLRHNGNEHHARWVCPDFWTAVARMIRDHEALNAARRAQARQTRDAELSERRRIAREHGVRSPQAVDR